MIFDLLELNDWVKVEDIQRVLQEKYDKKVSRRALRTEREKYNERFYNHETEYCIARSSKGYKKTKLEEDIIKSEQADFKQAIDLITKYHKSRKARGENLNLRLEIKNGKLTYMEEEN